MEIKQISIFVENKPGRLAKITSLLAENSVDIRALSIADTTDYGILRLIVSDPEKAEKVLKEAKMTVSITHVLGIGIPDVPGGFSVAIKTLADAGISVEYAYAFITPDGKSLCYHDEDNDAAKKPKDANTVIEQDEILFK